MFAKPIYLCIAVICVEEIFANAVNVIISAMKSSIMEIKICG